MLSFKGLKATQEHLTVSEAMIDQQINKLLEQRMKIVPITDRPAQLDDELVLDYAGEVNGDFFQGGTAEKQTLVLGSGMFIPGFEQQLVGCSIGDDVDVKVTFPEQYHAPDLAGKEAVFHCKIHEIRIKMKYQLDDEFAKEVGGCETMEAFRKDMRKALQDYVDGQSDAELKDNLLNQLCDSCDLEISEEQLNGALDYEMQMFEAQLGRQGLNLDMYCQFTQTTKEQLREDHIPTARRNILRQHVIDEIAKQEKVEADVNSVADMLNEICRQNGMTIEELEPHMDDNFQAAVEQSVINTKVLNLIRDNAEIEVVEKQA